MEKLKYKIGITLIHGIGCILAKNLIAYLGDVEAVFREKKMTLMKIPGIGEVLATQIVNQKVLEQAEKEVEFITKHKIKPLFYLDEAYPQRLRNCDDSPILIFTHGNVNFNQQKVLSIVGTRNASEHGKELTAQLIKDLAENQHNPIIISGLAYGIDIAAHKAALKHNLPTIAVLAHGLDTIYPPVHKPVAIEILKNGALATEFLSKSKIDRKNFVSRNRIVAGMADATIVVESGIKGGALVTADIAWSYDRDVLAFPGKPNDKYSAGCNYLIKRNKAALIESVADIEYCLGWDAQQSTVKPQQKELFNDFSPEEKQIVEILKENGKLSIDIIAAFANMPMSKVSAILLNLEFAGFVKAYPGKMYEMK